MTRFIRPLRLIIVAGLTYLGFTWLEPYGLGWMVLPVGLAVTVASAVYAYRKRNQGHASRPSDATD